MTVTVDRGSGWPYKGFAMDDDVTSVADVAQKIKASQARMGQVGDMRQRSIVSAGSGRCGATRPKMASGRLLATYGFLFLQEAVCFRHIWQALSMWEFSAGFQSMIYLELCPWQNSLFSVRTQTKL